LSAYPTTVFGDTGNLFRDTQTLVDASLQRRVDALSRWKLRAFAGVYSFRGDYIVDVPPVTLNRDRAQARWWGVESDFFTERFDAHKLVVGAEAQWSPRRDQSNDDVAPVAASYLDDHRSGRRFALFVEDQWQLSPVWSITAGARHDAVRGSGAQLSPRIAVLARPSDELLLKFIHGSAFRPPNAYEMAYSVPTPGGYKGNPALRDERVRGDEFVLELRPSASSRWTASAYSNRAHHLLVQTVDPADGLLVFNNAGTLRARGVELEAEQAWQNGARVRANLSVQRVSDPSNNGLDARNAAQFGKLIALLPVGSGWTLGSEWVGVARRGVVPGYGAMNLTLSSQLRPQRLALSLSVYDVFDRHASDPGGDSVVQPTAPQDGRSVRLKLDFKF
jgi:outer membrane receptor protein involved in Fe transport